MVFVPILVFVGIRSKLRPYNLSSMLQWRYSFVVCRNPSAFNSVKSSVRVSTKALQENIFEVFLAHVLILRKIELLCKTISSVRRFVSRPHCASASCVSPFFRLKDHVPVSSSSTWFAHLSTRRRSGFLGHRKLCSISRFGYI